MCKKNRNLANHKCATDKADNITDMRCQEALLKTRFLQNAALNSANFFSIVTDEKGDIQILNVGVEPMLYKEVVACAKALCLELGVMFTSGACNTLREVNDIYQKECIRKDGSRFMAIVSVTTLRDAINAIIGYLLLGTYKIVRKLTDDGLPMTVV